MLEISWSYRMPVIPLMLRTTEMPEIPGMPGMPGMAGLH